MSFQWTVETFEDLASTQDLTRARANSGAPQGLVIHAQGQSAGYGRHGRAWVSLPGNLFLSFLLRPNCEARIVEQMSVVVGVALARGMQAQMIDPALLRIKSPNDIFLDGKKAAGILIESNLTPDHRVEWIVAGIGVNLQSVPEGPFSALQPYAAEPLNSNSFRDEFLKNMYSVYSDWQAGEFESIRAEWNALLRDEDKVYAAGD